MFSLFWLQSYFSELEPVDHADLFPFPAPPHPNVCAHCACPKERQTSNRRTVSLCVYIIWREREREKNKLTNVIYYYGKTVSFTKDTVEYCFIVKFVSQRCIR